VLLFQHHPGADAARDEGPMSKGNQPLRDLSRRERQIMDVIYRRGRATAGEVQADLPLAPSYSAVRALLRVLEEKGLLRHEQECPPLRAPRAASRGERGSTRFVYLPIVAAARARGAALRGLLETFFEGSAEQAVAALLDLKRDRLSREELDRLARLIAQARKEGR
jgi:BlaI family penicillinase repressor